MFALDFLGVLLPHVMLLGIEMPLVGPPPVRVELRDAEGLQQRLQPQEDLVLPPSEHISQHLPSVVINGMPQPTRIRFVAHVTPHLVQLGSEPTPSIQFLGAAYL